MNKDFDKILEIVEQILILLELTFLVGLFFYAVIPHFTYLVY